MENRDHDQHALTQTDKSNVANIENLNRHFAQFVEEDPIGESPPDAILQTATTCVIPLPVYECTAQEWRLESPVQEWVEFEKSKSLETLHVPIISQCYVQTPSKVIEDTPQYRNTKDNNDLNKNNVIRTSLDSKSLDKLKRRKGMYIDYTAWEVPNHDLANLQNISTKVHSDLELSLNYASSTDFASSKQNLDAPIVNIVQEKTEKLRTNQQNNLDSNELISAERTTYRHFHSNSHNSLSDEQRRYSKRPLRGPYGQMLEAEMMKPKKHSFENIQNDDQDRTCPIGSQRLRERNLPHYSSSMRVQNTNKPVFVPQHPRASSIPFQTKNTYERERSVVTRNEMSTESHTNRLANFPNITAQQAVKIEVSDKQTHHNKNETLKENKARQSEEARLKSKEQLLLELLKGSSEQMLFEQRQLMFLDTRTHVVQEIYKNEQSYVESLQTVVVKYLAVLKSPDHAGMVDVRTVDEIFFMVPDILAIHEKFLTSFKSRLDAWDAKQKVGDVFIEVFSKLEVLEVYTSFVNNCNRAKNAIRMTKNQRPPFAKFLESTAREHKGKLTLDNLLIKPVQKFPNYELLFQRLIKHTEADHPDQKHLQDVLKLVHDILVHINCKEREILENDQRETTLRELEYVIEGVTDLLTPDRQFLLFDLVSMPSGQGARKERGAFLFNDLLILTSVKKRSGTIRKPNTSFCPSSVAQTLDTNKYKFLTKISLECLEIVKNKDDTLKSKETEMENLEEDFNKLQQIIDIVISLKYPHQYLEDVVRELNREVQRHLADIHLYDAQLNLLDLKVNSTNGNQKLSILFNKTEKRTLWEKTLTEAKQKIVSSLEKHQMPEFLTSIPIRKTRAGLQFTCAAATLSNKRDVWVCNSDGYVGQVCIMSLNPEPNVTSCNGVCNARILCLASVPGYEENAMEFAKDEKHIRCMSQKCSDSHTNKITSKKSPTVSSSSMEKKSTVFQDVDKPIRADKLSSNLNNNKKDRQIDLNLSSSDDEPDNTEKLDADSENSSIPSTTATAAAASSVTSDNSSATSLGTSSAFADHVKVQSEPALHLHQNSNTDESEKGLSTMWIGTEDGCIHVYNSTDNIRIKKNRVKIELNSAVYSILYLDNRVFVSLANGNICVYSREAGCWNTNYTHCLNIGSASSPVTKLLDVQGNVWCSIQGFIKVLDAETLTITKQTQISSESKPITNMTTFDNYVWISIQNSALIKCFHYFNHQLVAEVNLAPVVNKMLSNCDEIIRQHKAACLRVTSLLYCRGLIWIGTSAGVLLTIPARDYDKGSSNIVPSGIPHGHTGHVRFLSFVELPSSAIAKTEENLVSKSTENVEGKAGDKKLRSPQVRKRSKIDAECSKILVISGGDGYEDFRNSGINSFSEIAGREDSTNHLLIWQI